MDVRFEPLGDDRTRVVLEHRDLEAYGADAATMHRTFERPAGDPFLSEGVIRAYEIREWNDILAAEPT